MEYSFSYLLWNENTCKTHKKQVFQNKYSNPKSENFYFLLLKMISKLLHSLMVVEKYFSFHLVVKNISGNILCIHGNNNKRGFLSHWIVCRFLSKKTNFGIGNNKKLQLFRLFPKVVDLGK
jgi:hypothetical protein